MKKSKDRLKKREFKAVVYNTVCACMRQFGYTKYPYIRETELPRNAIMCFTSGYPKGKSVISIDYRQFLRCCGDEGRRNSAFSAAYMTAHEMRHYYQFRQMRAENPREKQSVVNAWRQEKPFMQKKLKDEYYSSSREIDAFAFAYIYLAEEFGVIKSQSSVPEGYNKVIAKYLKKSFGVKHEIFGKKYGKYYG